MKCIMCNIEKDIEEFSWKYKSKGIRHKRCKLCVSLSVKKHYLNDKDKYKRKALRLNKEYVRRNKDFILEYLKNHPCKDCGEADPIVLDFDHVRGDKKMNISTMIQQALSLKSIEEEISKCEVRCSNCHRRKTAKERGYYKRRGPADRGTQS